MAYQGERRLLPIPQGVKALAPGSRRLERVTFLRSGPRSFLREELRGMPRAHVRACEHRIDLDSEPP